MDTGTITERGNGFPSDGDYVVSRDGQQLYRVVEVGSTIHTAEPGSGNYVYATCTPADWSECSESDTHSAEFAPDAPNEPCVWAASDGIATFDVPVTTGTRARDAWDTLLATYDGLDDDASPIAVQVWDPDDDIGRDDAAHLILYPATAEQPRRWELAEVGGDPTAEWLRLWTSQA